MLFFILPRSNPYIYRNIQVTTVTGSGNDDQKEIDTPSFLSHTIAQHLHETKLQISKNVYQWEIYRKYTNPYEFIHTHIPFKKVSVSKYDPLSRSYFKMIEMIYKFDFNIFSNSSTPIKSFHLAEAPGGFIEAVVSIRKKNSPYHIQSRDIYYGMTLHDEITDETPTWTKGAYFFKENPNVILENGYDGTGNILSVHNFQYMKKKYGSSIDFITADGGFDFSKDFEKQESMMLPLLYGQVAYALTLQRKGGCFVLKIFDCFAEATLDILFLLTSMYEQVYICKPCTSRLANSEKYIICKNFLYASNYSFYPHLVMPFASLVNAHYSAQTIARLFNIPIPISLYQRMEEVNYLMGKEQIANIDETMYIISNNYRNTTGILNEYIKNNVYKCVLWCIKHNIPVNKSCSLMTK
jgi:23S rRNA U2552 (ribose-2'-O)-methylase RlmE/FtsJ